MRTNNRLEVRTQKNTSFAKTKITVIADGSAGDWLLVDLCEDAERGCDCAFAVDQKETSLLFFDDLRLYRTLSNDAQRFNKSDDFLRSFSLADLTGLLAQPKLNLIFDPLCLNQCCAKIFVSIDESNPSIAFLSRAGRL